MMDLANGFIFARLKKARDELYDLERLNSHAGGLKGETPDDGLR